MTHNLSTGISSDPRPIQPDPRVTALVDALQHYACDCSHACEGTSSCGDYARTAIAAFNTTDKPQGVNNEVKGGKDE